MNEVSRGDLPGAAPQPPERVDGRRLRSARTRQSIIEAYLALLRQRPHIPTAEQVARHAALSERAVFSHFTDLEALGIAAFDYILSQGLSTPIGGMLNADRGSRIRFQAEVRARNCENWLPLWRVVERGYLTSEEIAQRVKVVREMTRARIALMYRPELSTLTESDQIVTVSAIESLVEFESWGRLREHYRLSVKDARAAWIKMIDRLLPATPQR
jgi:AcrR family transcriptional regulator